MRIGLLRDTRAPILELVESACSIQDALDIVSASHEHATHRVLLRARDLPPEFFELQTRFAGEFIQKLVNYRLRVAGVFGRDLAVSERFREFVGEARQGQQFRSFTLEAEAISWLESL